MIISRMDGGLGNQMFQYAYGLYLSHRHATSLVLDTGSYAATPQHGFLLDKLSIQAEVAGPEHQPLIPARYRAVAAAVGRAASGGLFKRLLNSSHSLPRHKEAPFGFRPRHLRVPDNRYLVGYWQSERYFPGMRSTLLDHFQLRRALSPHSQRVSDRIRNTNSAVLHVRRGDYVTDPAAAALYCRLDGGYYLRSLQDWAATQAQVEIFVFSNDMRWCRQHIDLPWKTHWVDHNTCDTAHEDLILMSQAACCVIANSTFSWWAAWLNERPGKVIYAPPAWFSKGALDGSSILPSDWKVVPQAVPQAA